MDEHLIFLKFGEEGVPSFQVAIGRFNSKSQKKHHCNQSKSTDQEDGWANSGQVQKSQKVSDFPPDDKSQDVERAQERRLFVVVDLRILRPPVRVWRHHRLLNPMSTIDTHNTTKRIVIELAPNCANEISSKHVNPRKSCPP